MNGSDAAKRIRARRHAAVAVARRHQAEWDAEYVAICQTMNVQPRPKGTLAEALHEAATVRMRSALYGGGALDDSIIERAEEAMRKVREQ